MTRPHHLLRATIIAALDETETVTDAARKLGVSRATLYRRLRSLSLLPNFSAKRTLFMRSKARARKRRDFTAWLGRVRKEMAMDRLMRAAADYFDETQATARR